MTTKKTFTTMATGKELEDARVRGMREGLLETAQIDAQYRVGYRGAAAAVNKAVAKRGEVLREAGNLARACEALIEDGAQLQ